MTIKNLSVLVLVLFATSANAISNGGPSSVLSTDVPDEGGIFPWGSQVSGGHYAFIWYPHPHSGSGGLAASHFRITDQNGIPVSQEFILDPTPFGQVDHPALSNVFGHKDSPQFGISGTGIDLNTAEYKGWVRILDGAGATIRDDLLDGSDADHVGVWPGAAMAADGGYIVTWLDARIPIGSDGDHAHYVRRVSPSGAVLWTTQVATYTSTSPNYIPILVNPVLLDDGSVAIVRQGNATQNSQSQYSTSIDVARLSYSDGSILKPYTTVYEKIAQNANEAILGLTRPIAVGGSRLALPYSYGVPPTTSQDGSRANLAIIDAATSTLLSNPQLHPSNPAERDILPIGARVGNRLVIAWSSIVDTSNEFMIRSVTANLDGTGISAPQQLVMDLPGHPVFPFPVATGPNSFVLGYISDLTGDSLVTPNTEVAAKPFLLGDPDLRPQMRPISPNPSIGQPFELNARVGNRGTGDASDVRIKFIGSEAIKLRAATGAGWTCAQDGDAVLCSQSANLAPNTLSEPLGLRVDTRQGVARQVRITATASSSGADLNPADNSVSEQSLKIF